MAVDTRYDVGDEVPMAFDYAVDDGTGTFVPTDPADLALHIVLPTSGALALLTYPADIEKTDTGSYFYGYPATEPGWLKWYWRVLLPVPKVVQAEVYIAALPH